MADVQNTSSDYVLRWPRDLFKRETAELLNSRASTSDWNDRCELLLEDAFISAVPRDDFKRVASTGPSWTSSSQVGAAHQFLVGLLRRADKFSEAGRRTPYWSQRHTGSTPEAVTTEAVAREVVRLINDLESRGYFEQAFQKDCVDAPSDVDPAALIEMEVGTTGLWPLSTSRLAENTDDFFDVIEVLHDLVSRPRTRRLHPYAGCGWHHDDYSTAAGQDLYRWSVNRLLERTSLGLRLADEGEDTGRLVVVTDAARGELVERMAQRADATTGDVVRHALALFRSRGAAEHDKRSAVITLAGVLEERRALLKSELLRKDEGALFQIANEFAIRHRREGQKPDYDPAFLDWVYYWYLSTIDLTDRVLERQQVAE